MLVYVVIVFIAYIVGFIQSLIIGVYSGSWDGGTGCAYGIISSIIALFSSFWLKWDALWVVVILSIISTAVTCLQIYKDKNK